MLAEEVSSLISVKAEPSSCLCTTNRLVEERIRRRMAGNAFTSCIVGKELPIRRVGHCSALVMENIVWQLDQQTLGEVQLFSGDRCRNWLRAGILCSGSKLHS